jgi:hypothetical protein
LQEVDLHNNNQLIRAKVSLSLSLSLSLHIYLCDRSSSGNMYGDLVDGVDSWEWEKPAELEYDARRGKLWAHAVSTIWFSNLFSSRCITTQSSLPTPRPDPTSISVRISLNEHFHLFIINHHACIYIVFHENEVYYVWLIKFLFNFFSRSKS